MAITEKRCVSGIAPFNEHRFDACFALFLRQYDSELTQYDMVKLHILVDFFHILRTGRPVIGGAMEKWPHGPVVANAYNRLDHWHHTFQDTRTQPIPFWIIREYGQNKNTAVFGLPIQHRNKVEQGFFSGSELEEIRHAHEFYGALPNKFDFFHSPFTFVGRVWSATRDNDPISLGMLIDEYDAEYREDHSHIKAIIGCEW